jgi:hypothetical protein
MAIGKLTASGSGFNQHDSTRTVLTEGLSATLKLHCAERVRIIRSFASLSRHLAALTPTPAKAHISATLLQADEMTIDAPIGPLIDRVS